MESIVYTIGGAVIIMATILFSSKLVRLLIRETFLHPLTKTEIEITKNKKTGKKIYKVTNG